MPTYWTPRWLDVFRIFSNQREESSRNCHENTDDNIVSCPSDQGKNDQQFGKYTWILKNFSKLNVYHYRSDNFEVGGSKWNITLYSRGGDEGALSVYLEVADVITLPFGWSISAYFNLSVVNQLYPKATLKRGARHEFTERQVNWGFTALIPLRELHDASKGYLLNDILMLEVDVRVQAANNLRHACEANCKEETEEETDWHFFDKEKTDEEDSEEEETDEEDSDEEEVLSYHCVPIKVAQENDFEKQIGKDIHFDLVDFDKVRSFRVQLRTVFKDFKKKVAKDLGVPVVCQRFWLWSTRIEHQGTYRPTRPLTDQEELQTVHILARFSNLNLFLEVSVPFLEQQVVASHSEKKTDDILLFFKLYNPEKEELRYVGRILVKACEKPTDIRGRLNELAGFASSDEINLYEEITFKPMHSPCKPSFLCEQIDAESTFWASQLQDGDIICYQKALSKEEDLPYRYPDVPSFLHYASKRQIVHFRHLEKRNEDEFCLELSKELECEEVAKRVAKQLGLEDVSKIKLTSHDYISQKPNPKPINTKDRSYNSPKLRDMLKHYNQISCILYFQICPCQS